MSARASLTERAKTAICAEVGADNHSVAQVARAYGVCWETTMNAVRERGVPLVDDPARLDGVTALGLDETAFLKANRFHHTTYVTGMVDVRTGRLLDIVHNRTAAAVSTWLDGYEKAWLAAIDTVTIDPHQGYANGVAEHLAHATLVVDHFHSIKLGNTMVDDVRRRVQQQTLGHRGRKDDPLYGVRRVLLTGAERLTARQWARLEAAWDLGDPNHEVYNAWAVKEALRDVYRSGSLPAARAELVDCYAWAKDSGVAECRRLARTVRRWECPLRKEGRSSSDANLGGVEKSSVPPMSSVSTSEGRTWRYCSSASPAGHASANRPPSMIQSLAALPRIDPGSPPDA
jgi:transposase